MRDVVRPNKKINLFWITCLTILGRVDTPIFLIIFFPGKNNNFMHFEQH